MKSVILFLYCSLSFCNANDLKLSVDYKSVAKDGLTTFYFDIQNGTGEVYVINHLEVSNFSWDVLRSFDGLKRSFSHGVPNGYPQGYSFLGEQGLRFHIDTKSKRITSRKTEVVKGVLRIKGCKLSDFKKHGFDAFRIIKIPLNTKSNPPPKPR